MHTLSSLSTINAVSYLAPNMFWFYQAVTETLAGALDTPVVIAPAYDDPLEDEHLQSGQVDLAFICGLPLMRLVHQGSITVQELMAPVFQSGRYSGQPVYFADFIVRADSPYQTLGDLQGKTFAYNDPGSNSGFYLPSHHLLKHGYPSHFFHSLKRSGAHHQSIRWVMDGLADAAAIDSIVLEQAIRDNPQIASYIRVIDSTAPCPVPPIALLGQNRAWTQQVRTALLQPDAPLQAAMRRAEIQKFAAVPLADYQVIYDLFAEVTTANYQLAAVNR